MSQTSSIVTSTTYHKFKGRLYRIMGPFLGRKRQTNQLRRLLDVRHELTNWYSSVPDLLKCSSDTREFNNRPMVIQMQAISLQLAYDNLQMVLFRQAVFPINAPEHLQPHGADSIDQLSQSAIRTADVSTLAATGLISRSSHAAMHVGLCSFTAGVILCTLLAYQPNHQERTNWRASLKKIIFQLEQLPSENYRLATQSVQLLKTLESKVDPHAAYESAGGSLSSSGDQASKCP